MLQVLEVQIIVGSLTGLVITQAERYYSKVLVQECSLFPYDPVWSRRFLLFTILKRVALNFHPPPMFTIFPPTFCLFV